MLIRTALPSDSERLTEIARAAKASWGYPGEWLDAWRDELTLTVDYIQLHRALVAEIDGDIVGLCVLEDHDDTWTIEHMWVDPVVQGRGVGRALVKEVLSIVTSVRPGVVRALSDPYAEPFYARMGARKVEDVPAPMPGALDRTLSLMEFCV